MDASKLPAGLTVSETNINAYFTDPDIVYPQILKDMKAAVNIDFDGEVDQYWLEVAYNVMKLDFDRAIRAAGHNYKQMPTNHVRGGEGYKDRWMIAKQPVGKRMKALTKEHGDDAWRAIARESRAIYALLRG